MKGRMTEVYTSEHCGENSTRTEYQLSGVYCVRTMQITTLCFSEEVYEIDFALGVVLFYCLTGNFTHPTEQ